MATIQVKISRGHKYWYIVESRRVNGKPRPIVLAYLGKASDLLKRLQGLTDQYQLKSYSHGAVASLLKIADELNVCEIINQYVKSSKKYMADKPIRHHLTVGATFLLAAMGRVCMPTSKHGWLSWAKNTSLAYLLKCNFNKVDSQHFWDLMDALPVSAIEKIEDELIKVLIKRYTLESDTLFLDTTNFFTYIQTTNERCTIAKRGRNKQKRFDLRQIGLALVVTRIDKLPLFHLVYEGNEHDSKLFPKIISKVKDRINTLGFELDKHTIVFDRGNNSKENFTLIKENGLHYVGALTPYQHQSLVGEALNQLQPLEFNADTTIQAYREKRDIWDEQRTIIVYISNPLRNGQLRGIHQSIKKITKALSDLQATLLNPRAKKRGKEALEIKINQITKGQFMSNMITWSLIEKSEGKFHLQFSVNEKQLEEIHEKLGIRILMTDRHGWSTIDIIKSYHGQSQVEQAFKDLKNPYHLTIKPQFHWTDQKIKMHFFICVLGYLLASIIRKEVNSKGNFNASMDTLLNLLNNIRLATVLEAAGKRGQMKANYKLEQMSQQEQKLLEVLGVTNTHNIRSQLRGFSVYT